MLIRHSAILVALLFLLPALAGLAGVVFPAFGFFPLLGGEKFTLHPLKLLFSDATFWSSVKFSFVIGFSSTLISLFIVLLFFAFCHEMRLVALARRFFSPLLSIPHVTIAIGLAFLVAPSGWIARALSPGLTGWERPPDLATSPDSFGILMVVGLVVKETPFLFLMALSALNQINMRERLNTAKSLGYSPAAAWLKTVLPDLYKQITLPLYAVLAFSVSVVDMGLILAPNIPVLLSIQILDWYNDPDLSYQFLAAGGALIQLLLCAGSILLLKGLALILAFFARRFFIETGGRVLPFEKIIGGFVILLILLLSLMGAFSLFGLGLWSFALDWRYPDFLPTRFHTGNWAGFFTNSAPILFQSLIIAGASALIALVLTILCLEAENRYGRRFSSKGLLLLYLPLLVPQIAFLFGLQILLFAANIQGSWFAMIWGHVLFALPYCFLSLGDFWRKLDERYRRSALCMGASPARVLWRITLPLLFGPILVAFAIGFAVGLAQYLPVILLGAGRFSTLTTEAVILAGSGDRRLVGVYGSMQTLLPALAFILALWVPGRIYKNSRTPEA